MITLKGPHVAEGGSTVCITAKNVGSGFVATAVSQGMAFKLKITIDLTKHTATICFTAPPSPAGVAIYVKDNATPRGTSHSVISK